MWLPCKVPMGTPRARRQLLPREKAVDRYCERKRVPVKKHAGGVFQRRSSVRRSAVTREIRRAACPGVRPSRLACLASSKRRPDRAAVHDSLRSASGRCRASRGSSKAVDATDSRHQLRRLACGSSVHRRRARQRLAPLHSHLLCRGALRPTARLVAATEPPLSTRVCRR